MGRLNFLKIVIFRPSRKEPNRSLSKKTLLKIYSRTQKPTNLQHYDYRRSREDCTVDMTYVHIS